MRSRVEAGGRIYLKAVTQISACDKRHSLTRFVDGQLYTIPKTSVLYVTHERVSQSDNLSAPSVLEQEVQRNRSAMVQVDVTEVS